MEESEAQEAEEERLNGFLRWAAKLGISDSPNPIPKHSSCLGHSLSISLFPHAGGRGLAAVRDLWKGELILRVPKSALITSESLLKDDQALTFSVSRYPSLSPTQILTLCLLYEMGKGKSSRWHPYLVHLPRSYELLATFSEFEMQALQVNDAVWTTEKAVSKVELQWKEASPLMEELKLQPRIRSFKAWIWASSTISSRTMHVPWDEAGCLCPVGDFFNYAAPGEGSKCFENLQKLHQTSPFENGSLSFLDDMDTFTVKHEDAHSQSLTDGVFEEEKAAYCFYARRNYIKGEQVLLSYGTYTNLELLEHYGFLLDENPNDKVFITLEPTMFSSNSWPKESMFIHPDGKPSFALSSALRLWATPISRRRSVGHLAYSGAQLSVDNEVAVLNWILGKCRAILSDLPTTVEQDISLLSTIDKIQSFPDSIDLRNLLRKFGGEASLFLEANPKHCSCSELLLDREARNSIGRWKLAVQWRCKYKKILTDCISYCSEGISSLKSEKCLGCSS